MADGAVGAECRRDAREYSLHGCLSTMTDMNEEIVNTRTHHGAGNKQSLVVRVTDNDFQCQVLEKLGRLETKMDMLVGDSQPGRMSLAENRIQILEANDIRRSVYDRIVNAAISVAISAAIAMHDRLGIR
jgi:hypothetical protein